MSYTARLVRGGSAVYAFTTTPFTEPKHTPEWDTQEPPILAALAKSHTLTGILVGASETATVAAWDALKAVLEVSGANQIDGVELLRSGTVVDSITVAGGYQGFKWEVLEAPKSDLQWRGEMRFTLRISGRKRFSTGAGGLGATVSRLDQHESWSYDETGLLTRSLAGEVETTSGSAVAIARTIFLSLPSSSFGRVTNGPEGVDVERLDLDDTQARYTSTIREVGRTLPAAVGPSFSVERTVAVEGGETVTTTTIRARGTGAEAAVLSKIPAGSLASSKITVDEWQREASGTFVVRSASNGATTQIVRTHRFELSGGGRRISWTLRTGNRAPLKHVGPYEPVNVAEEIGLENSGADGANFTPPSPLDGLAEDTSASRTSGPARVQIGADRSGDRWALQISRRYTAPDASTALGLIVEKVLAFDTSGSLADEGARKGTPEA